LIALAPVVAAQLDTQVELARERGTALVLDAALPPTDKIELAPRLFADIESDDPRDALAAAMERERRRVSRQDRDLLSRLDRLEDQLREEGSSDDLLGQIESTLGVDADDLIAQLEGSELAAALEARFGERNDPRQVRRELTRLEGDLDDVVLAAVDAAFSPAFALTGALALLAALALLPRLRRRQGTVVLSARRGLQAGALALAVLAALAVPLGYAIAVNDLSKKPVEIADPCQERERRLTGGVEGTIEGAALDAIDRAACKHGASREKLVLALFDESSSRAYEREFGVKPRSLDAILRSAIGF
jgi:hypothetical protein